MSNLLHKISEYYSKKIEQFGCTPNGVDWNSLESQIIRFNQLLKICEKEDTFSLGDFGCGYGALANYLADKNKLIKYHGFDISKLMIENATSQNAHFSFASFSTNIQNLNSKDFIIASGIFNVQMETSNEDWLSYMKNTLNQINDFSIKGFSFNALTSYSDKEKMKDYLYYSDPLFWFDYCKKNFSTQVALLHDYGLYEFTILVRKS